MSTFEARLQRREEVAHGTMAFHFEKPAGFGFKPGQAIDVVVPGAPSLGTGSDRHAFSIVSAAFLVELQPLARVNRGFQLIATMTQMEKSRAPSGDDTGPIDERLVRRIVGKLLAPISYLVGPPGMVESMRETLGAAGVATTTFAVRRLMVTDSAGPLATSQPGCLCGLNEAGTPAACRPSNGQEQP